MKTIVLQSDALLKKTMLRPYVKLLISEMKLRALNIDVLLIEVLKHSYFTLRGLFKYECK